MTEETVPLGENKETALDIARRRYVLAYLRAARAAIDEVGKLLDGDLISTNDAVAMIEEIKGMYF